jgi:hypothetical protein
MTDMARRRNGKERRQKGKGKSRDAGWHRYYEPVELPTTPEASRADPTSGHPTPLRRKVRRRGDAL